jgi:Domain of unknown function (DUF4291)
MHCISTNYLKMNERIIRASYDNETITVYQAYCTQIAKAAVKAQTFVTPFKKDRMTWIKPSYLWMMYRSGWATKENQERILAIKIKKEGFEWALHNSCLSHFDASIHPSQEVWNEHLHKSPIRIQWDPEKDLFLNPLPYRSIQIGISGIGVEKYTSDWIVKIDDITDFSTNIHHLILSKEIEQAKRLLPIEEIYPLSNDIALKINAQ